MPLSTAPCVLVVGAGDVGGRLAAMRAARGDQVVAVRRRDAAAGAGVRAERADVATGEGVARLPRRPEALVFCAAPDRRDEAAYRALFVDGLRRVLDALDPGRVLFVSSTAVYGEDTGEWVDEATPAQPPAFNGRALLAAEAELAAHPCAVALRLSGLYGPGRDALLRRALAGEASRPHWTNRIHVEDAAVALSQLVDLPTPARLYLGSDDRPALECDLQAWVRDRVGLPPVAATAASETGRRIRNGRLRATGWTPRWPDFAAGYAPLLAGAGV